MKKNLWKSLWARQTAQSKTTWLKKNKKSRAESLIEVVIAIFVVALGSSVATSLIVTSLQSNTFSRDNLIALNLAEEGIEAVRAIRDTNWLKYGFDKEDCWDLMTEAPACPASGPNDKISNNFYTVELHYNNYWLLLPHNQNLDLQNPSASNDLYQLKVVTRNGTFFYTHNSLSPPSQFSEETDHPQNNKFYRMIEISNVTADSMDVRALVQWNAQGNVHSVELNTRLTNYQKVKTNQ